MFMLVHVCLFILAGSHICMYLKFSNIINTKNLRVAHKVITKYYLCVHKPIYMYNGWTQGENVHLCRHCNLDKIALVI